MAIKTKIWCRFFPSHAENVNAKGNQPTLLAARRSAGVTLRGEWKNPLHTAGRRYETLGTIGEKSKTGASVNPHKRINVLLFTKNKSFSRQFEKACLWQTYLVEISGRWRDFLCDCARCWRRPARVPGSWSRCLVPDIPALLRWQPLLHRHWSSYPKQRELCIVVQPISCTVILNILVPWQTIHHIG